MSRGQSELQKQYISELEDELLVCHEKVINAIQKLSQFKNSQIITKLEQKFEDYLKPKEILVEESNLTIIEHEENTNDNDMVKKKYKKELLEKRNRRTITKKSKK
jgi:hypothetical protein